MSLLNFITYTPEDFESDKCRLNGKLSPIREPGEEPNSRLHRHKTSEYWELDWNKKYND